jgi:hypothetical protein
MNSNGQNGQPVPLGQNLVYSIFELKIEHPVQGFTISRTSAVNSPVQGLRLKAVHGQIDINDEKHPEVILWADTSPQTVHVSVISKSGCILKIWNVWKINGLIQAWIGNAGFLVNRQAGELKLECSDGTGAIDFSSLVVELNAR